MDFATERFPHLEEELSKLDGEIVLVDDCAGDGEDGVDAAYVTVTHYGNSTDVELFIVYW